MKASTIDALHKHRLESLAQTRAPESVISPKEIDYLLDVMPILKEYGIEQDRITSHAHFSGHTVQPPAGSKGDTLMDRYADRSAGASLGTLYLRYVTVTVDPLSKEYGEATHILAEMEDKSYVGVCAKCDVPMIIHTAEATANCPSCGISENYQDDVGTNASMTYEQEISRTTMPSFCYKRSNHFKEWIGQLQGKESTQIPDDVLDLIKAEFRKTRITSKEDINIQRVRSFLKKLGLNRYYEHTSYIAKLLGVEPPQMSPELEEKLLSMFAMIQRPFANHCPPTRANFISYSYVLFKFCQLLEQDAYLKYFPLLKSRAKLKSHDDIWKNICADLNWEFIRSI